MKAQYDNELLSNFLFYLDNKILSKGQAFTNHGSLFYPVDSAYNGYFTYAAPFKQMVCDISVSGAQIVSGIFINGVYHAPGSGDFISINPDQGQAYFTSNKDSSVISGNYAVKDINIAITDEMEEDLLFETQYFLRPGINQTITGMSPDAINYPIIFLKVYRASNKPFALGALDNTTTNIRAIILADSAFLLDAACSIMRDCKNDRFALISQSVLPFDSLGGCTGNFNYTGLNTPKMPLICEVDVSKILLAKGQMSRLNPDVLCAFADFEISDLRKHN